MRSTTQKRRRRFVRPLAIAGSAVALAAPATAGAVQLDSTLPAAHSGTQQAAPDQVGARLDHRGLNDAQKAPFVTTVHVQTAGDDGTRTLSIALASSALGIALFGSGYAAFSAARIHRRLSVTE
jgi:hypothetical protein